MSADQGSVGEKRLSQWEELMRKFSQAHEVHCKAVSVDIPRMARSVKHFPTGSKYDGTWDVLGMSGYGVYTFPNGVIYEGEFDDGMFDGRGELRYPCGATLRGTWSRGKLGEKTLIFDDGLNYSENAWPYCLIPDRRYTIEHNTDVQPGGESYITAVEPPREIPAGFYDTGDGFYDPSTNVVFKSDQHSPIIRFPNKLEQKWFKENCRVNPDVTVGPRYDLYEEWMLPMMQLVRAPSRISMSHISLSNRFSTDYDSDSEEEVDVVESSSSSTSEC